MDTEILLLQNDGAMLTDTDVTRIRSSIAMNAGNNCRVLYAFSLHNASECPWNIDTRSHQECVIEINRNFAKFLSSGRRHKGAHIAVGIEKSLSGSQVPGSSRPKLPSRTPY